MPSALMLLLFTLRQGQNVDQAILRSIKNETRTNLNGFGVVLDSTATVNVEQGS